MNWTARFLHELAINGNISRSATAAGISSTTVRNLRKADADFAAAMDDAIEDSTDVLELEARRRAVHGVPEPVVYQGQLTPVWQLDANGDVVTRPELVTQADGKQVVVNHPVQERDEFGRPKYLTVSKYSDALLAMLLKGNRRSKYGDKTEISGPGGGPIQMDETKRVSRIAALMAMAKDRMDIG